MLDNTDKMEVKYEIRESRPDEVSKLAELHYEAFKEYGDGDPKWIKGLVIDCLALNADPPNISLVAEGEQENPIGHILLTPHSLDKKPVYIVMPLSVEEGSRGNEIGSWLVNKALNQVRKQNKVGFVFIDGPVNYYKRFGFFVVGESEPPKATFTMGSKQTSPEEWMFLNLNSDESPIGKLKVRKEFTENCYLSPKQLEQLIRGRMGPSTSC